MSWVVSEDERAHAGWEHHPRERAQHEPRGSGTAWHSSLLGSPRIRDPGRVRVPQYGGALRLLLQVEGNGLHWEQGPPHPSTNPSPARRSCPLQGSVGAQISPGGNARELGAEQKLPILDLGQEQGSPGPGHWGHLQAVPGQKSPPDSEAAMISSGGETETQRKPKAQS